MESNLIKVILVIIGEEQVNLALRRFINDWRSYIGIKKTKTNRYATSKDLIKYFKEVTPRESHDVLYDLFETNKAIN